MRTLLLLIAVLLCVSIFAEPINQGFMDDYSDRDAKRAVNQVVRDIEEGRLPIRLNRTIEAVLKASQVQLRRAGDKKLAKKIGQEWKSRYSKILVAEDYNIGDHKPLSAWLAVTYELIEAALISKLGHDLGMKVVVDFHIADIKTLNFCLPVAFNPCSAEWDKAEFVRHMVSDGIYHGLYPVITYWAVQIGCTFGTMGTGAFLICGIAAWGSEMGMERFVAPKLAPWLYDKMCGR